MGSRAVPGGNADSWALTLRVWAQARECAFKHTFRCFCGGGSEPFSKTLQLCACFSSRRSCHWGRGPGTKQVYIRELGGGELQEGGPAGAEGWRDAGQCRRRPGCSSGLYLGRPWVGGGAAEGIRRAWGGSPRTLLWAPNNEPRASPESLRLPW